MQISNVAYSALNTGFSANKTSNVYKNNFSPRLLNQADTVSFGRRRDDEEDGAEERSESSESSERREKPRHRGRGIKKVFKGAVGIAAALGLVSGGIQGYNAGSALLAQRELAEAFKNNPKNVAVAFVNTFASGDNVFGSGDMHFEYTENAVSNPFIIKDWNNSMIGPDSVVMLDFSEGAFSSASLDIDGDKYPEIAVTTDENGKLVISYDYDSDGKIDTVETLDKEGEE